MNKFFVVVFALLMLNGCVPPSSEPMTEVTNDIFNSEWQRVSNYADRGILDSLFEYTRHPNPTYRYLVANGLASIRNTKTLDTLIVLLNDPVSDVRNAAAYAIGQLNTEKATASLLNTFKSEDTLSVNSKLNSTILETVGKTGNEALLKSMATISTYRKSDDKLLLGQARAIYRYALRDMVIPEGTKRMLEFLIDKEYPASVRVIAANYLTRAKNIDLEKHKFQLGQLLNDENVFVRMNVAQAMKGMLNNEIFKILENQLEKEKDERVSIAILRSISEYPYLKMIDLVLVNLGNKNESIANVAADILIDKGNETDASIYRQFANDSLSPGVNAKIYASVLAHTPAFYKVSKNVINQILFKKYNMATDVYEKRAYIDAIGYDPSNCQSLINLIDTTHNPILKSKGVEVLYRMLKDENFVKTHSRDMKAVKTQIGEGLEKAIESGDVGTIAAASTILSDEALEFNTVLDSFEFLTTALNQLDLPRDIEASTYLRKAISTFEGKEYIETKPEFNHPIDFKVFEAYGDSAIAAVKTSKGVFRIELYPSKAPGSVASFLQLVEDDFYDGKAFHRVVPNFVIQTGCPRGDGYGSLDYTIRSEVGQSYYDDEGYVGMASAGPDTEATQWFVTHVPTPHLDGRYSIFGKVTEGMDVVRSIQVGDKIQDIIITKK